MKRSRCGPGSALLEREPARHGGPVVSRLAGGDPRFRAPIEKFVGRLTERMEAMQASWDAEDLEELGQLAHWLKGAAGTVGFDAFSGPAATLELLAREGKLSEIEASLEELRDIASRIVLPEDPA